MNLEWETFTLGAGVMASAIGGGTFFAFSNFVMPALSTLHAADGVAAMQAINRAAPSPGFSAALVASFLAGLPVVVAEVANLGSSQTRWALAAAVLGGVSLVITLGRNVAQNNELEAFDADSDAAAVFWSMYLRSWTRDNTLRAVASLASAVAYSAALMNR